MLVDLTEYENPRGLTTSYPSILPPFSSPSWPDRVLYTKLKALCGNDERYTPGKR